MAMILPKYSNVIEFYASRFLRIFVPYYLICGIILIVSLIFGIFLGEWLELDPFISFSTTKNGLGGVLFTTFSNVTIFLQDLSFFLANDFPNSLHFTANFRTSEYPLYEYLIVPQAWSISLELIFYLFVPILVKFSNRQLLIIIISSLTIRIFLYVLLQYNTNLNDQLIFSIKI